MCVESLQNKLVKVAWFQEYGYLEPDNHPQTIESPDFTTNHFKEVDPKLLKPYYRAVLNVSSHVRKVQQVEVFLYQLRYPNLLGE